MSALLELAERMDDFNDRLGKVFDNASLGVSGQANTAALLVALNAPMLREVAKTLRARATQGDQ